MNKEMRIIKIPCSEIVEYKNNPRKNDEAVDATAKSIQEFGMNDPIIVDENNVILAGHTRLKALKKMNIAEAPVVVVDWLTEKQKAKFRIAHNSTAQIAEWDLSKLNEEITRFELELENMGLDEQLKALEKEMSGGGVHFYG